MRFARSIHLWFLLLAFLLASLAHAQGDGRKVTITVSAGMAPTFSWSPDTEIGKIVVEEGSKEVWASETEGENAYGSPIRYSVHPEEAAEDEPALPLTAGKAYTVKLYRWISVSPEEFELVGSQEFVPEESEEEPDEPMAGIRPTMEVQELPADFRLTGTVSGPAWFSATDSIGGLTMVEPEEGGEPSSATVVKVLANETALVIGVRCYEDPGGIVVFNKARDSDLSEEDHILIVLDTFMDGRSGYAFAVNPAGARFDGLVIEQGEDVNSDWDAIWQAKTHRDEHGWYAEIWIPIKSLGYKKGLEAWGFNVQRRIQRLQETDRWSGANLDYEPYQTSQAGLLTGLPAFNFGVGLSVRPAAVGRATRPDSEASTDYSGDVSLDVTQRLGPNLLSALTVNTDFAETEVDVRQINLTRFPLFFPEKRSFFLEGADIFNFGVALDEDTMIPFFSRRIGLLGRGEDDQAEIAINAGGKVNGRVGNTNIGALVVNTRKIDSLDVGDIDEDIKVHVPQTTMGAVRISQNILEESTVGVLGTFGDQQGRSDSWMAGADFIFRTSNFLNEKNLSISGWGLANNREDLEGEKYAVGFRAEYPNDLLDMSFMTIRLGDGFDPSLSFVPRNDVHLWTSTAELNLRPSWSWLRQMQFELSGSLYNELDNKTWESYEATIQPLGLILESGDSIHGGITPGGDRPPENFEIASGVDIPPGSYEWVRYFANARSAQKRRVSAEVIYEFGDYYNGTLNTIEARLSLRPSAFFTLEFTGERSKGTVTALPEDVDEAPESELVERDFTEELVGMRLLLNFSSDLQFSSLTQYDTQSKEFGTNNKLRWTFHPLGDLFVVYNHNLARNKEEDTWEFVSNEFPIKLQYTWRF